MFRFFVPLFVFLPACLLYGSDVISLEERKFQEYFQFLKGVHAADGNPRKMQVNINVAPNRFGVMVHDPDRVGVYKAVEFPLSQLKPDGEGGHVFERRNLTVKLRGNSLRITKRTVHQGTLQGKKVEYRTDTVYEFIRQGNTLEFGVGEQKFERIVNRPWRSGPGRISFTGVRKINAIPMTKEAFRATYGSRKGGNVVDRIREFKKRNKKTGSGGANRFAVTVLQPANDTETSGQRAVMTDDKIRSGRRGVRKITAVSGLRPCNDLYAEVPGKPE